MSKLKIYKASAGSGKTYTLAKEYINLLFKSEDNFANTLAVTFTNKATAEMKNRIIKELFALANNQDSPYVDDIRNNFNLSDVQVSERAKNILNEILHNFSRFSITTIDSFIQRVLQAFTREIGMQYGYEIDFEVYQVLQDSVDSIFDDISDNKFLLEWLLKFTDHKISESKSWNLVSDLFTLGKEIFKEDYKQQNKKLSKKLADKDYLETYIEYLITRKKEIEKSFEDISEEALSVMADNGLTIDDFPFRKSGFINIFNKVAAKDFSEPGKRVLDAVDNIDKWSAKSAKAALKDAISTVFPKLNALLKKVVEMLGADIKEYNTVNLIQKHFFALGIISDIDKKITEYQTENNRILISEGATILHDIIDNNDTPFIYEKYGQSYRNFMIDEFQDTSAVQWSNFRPLLTTSLSEDNTSLVVGDIKQSIYRWRNGDWKLLANQLNHDMEVFGVENLTLSHNWRSKENVIRFNNTTFQVALNILSEIICDKSGKTEISDKYVEELRSAYNTIIQLLPPSDNTGGNVKVSFIDSESDKYDYVKENLPSAIEELQDRGYQAKDIAVLVRKGAEGSFVADLLMNYKDSEEASDKYNYDVISNDSLIIGASNAVKFIVCVIRYIDDESNEINTAQLLHVYNKYLRNTEPSLFDENYFENTKSSLSTLLGADVIQKIRELRIRPLLNQVEGVISLFEGDFFNNDMAYVQAFKDAVFDFTEKRSEDVSAFLEWWDNTGSTKKISASENQNAINIMTIHKSKGLEFKAVLIPFCDWSLEHDRVDNIIWAKTDKKPYSYIDVLPVNFSKSSLENSYFEEDYYKETLQTFVDNVNMLYVAFTRAENELLVYAKPTDYDLKELSKCRRVSDLLFRTFNNYGEFSSSIEKNCTTDLSGGWDEEVLTYSSGEFKSIESKDHSDNNEMVIKSFHKRSNKQHKLRVRNNLSEISEDTGITMIDYGIRMHKLFEGVNNKEDFYTQLDKFIYSGLIAEELRDELINKFETSLKNPEISEWFDEKYTVKAENSIIVPGGEIYRPDRILIDGNQAQIVDYKFGEGEESKYRTQLRKYKKYLGEAGYKTEAYIWYWSSEKVEKV